jgi:hypothetical protein
MDFTVRAVPISLKRPKPLLGSFAEIKSTEFGHELRELLSPWKLQQAVLFDNPASSAPFCGHGEG